MSNMAAAWLATYLVLTVLTLRRSSWGIGLYLLTFYAPPMAHAWGQGVLSGIGSRWSLVSALILAVGVLIDRRAQNNSSQREVRIVLWLMLIYAVNALLVHYMLADTPAQSMLALDKAWKHLALLYLFVKAVRDRGDYQILAYSMIVGGLYIGVAVYFLGVGRTFHGRLEGVQLGSADDANYLSGVLMMSMILAGYYGMFGTWKHRLVAIPTCALLAEVVQRCGSRGCSLGIFAALVTVLVFARARARRFAVIAIVLAVSMSSLVIGAQEREQWRKRIESIFVGEEERDASANYRTVFWSLGVEMIQKYPLGSGGDAAFKSRRGLLITDHIDLVAVEGWKAVHNGYLDIAASWGVQGLTIYLGALAVGARSVYRGMLDASRRGLQHISFLGVCLLAMLVLLLVTATFISSLKCEWFYWWVALAVKYPMLVESPQFGGGASSRMLIDGSSHAQFASSCDFSLIQH